VAEDRSLGAEEQPYAADEGQQDRQQKERKGPGTGGSRRSDFFMQAVEGLREQGELFVGEGSVRWTGGQAGAQQTEDEKKQDRGHRDPAGTELVRTVPPFRKRKLREQAAVRVTRGDEDLGRRIGTP
jgi:hypothetical protein